MRLLVLFFYMSLILFSIARSGALAYTWGTRDGHVFFRDTREHPYNIKGVNWYGGETLNHVPEGLMVHPISYYIAFLRNNGFNSIRLPFSYETYINFDTVSAIETVKADPSIFGKTYREIFHTIFYIAYQHNMTILLDFHTIGGVISEFPNQLPQISSDDTQNVLMNIITEFSQYPHLIGIDIKNEPHGKITWDEWSAYCQTIITRVQTSIPQFKGLFFIEGIQTTENNSAWGGSFTGMDKRMNDLLLKPRTVASPHVYGVSVRGAVAQGEGAADFEKWFGFLRHQDISVVIGEEGGMFIGSDVDWHNRLKDFLIEVNMRNTYYWCLNPTSMDTSGILFEDWTTSNYNKLQFLDALQPDPTFLTFPAFAS